jgi:ABC-type nickel/cobalt efflux system permease component RcnA
VKTTKVFTIDITDHLNIVMMTNLETNFKKEETRQYCYQLILCISLLFYRNLNHDNHGYHFVDHDCYDDTQDGDHTHHDERNYNDRHYQDNCDRNDDYRHNINALNNTS